LITEKGKMGDLDGWADMNSGEPEGGEIMDGLLGLIWDMRARVVSEVD
jgi:hypothetical protein